MKIVLFSLSSLFSVFFLFSQDPTYKLVWSDEFEGSGLPDANNWHFQTQWIIPGVGWANNEQQHYTDRIDNAEVKDGVLKIIAKKETFTDNQGTKEYTSARLNSKFAFTYGKVVVRAKLPDGIGTWPAIWTLGTNINETGGYWNDGVNQVPWPFTGEIDIMEQFGWEKETTHGTVHHGQESGGTSNTRSIAVPTSTSEFHNYEIIWNEEEIQFLVDDQLYFTYNPEIKYPSMGRNINTWPFFEPQYLLLNVAMGGVLGGAIDPNFTESTMEIDYVRVYQEDANAELDATLSELKVDGVLLDEFASDKFSYIYPVEEGTLTVPEVTFSKNNEEATVIVFEAEEIPGITTLQVTAADGVTFEHYTIEFAIAEKVLGIKDEFIKVYPNPSTSTIRMTLPNELNKLDQLNLRFIDIGGTEHPISVQRNASELSADISTLSTGVYFIQINSKELQIKVRFIKK